MDRAEIRALLEELASELEQLGVRGELLIVGGAAMALVYSTRRSTADVDALFEPKRVIYDAAARVASRHGLEPDWLNDAVKGYAPGPDPNATVFLELPALVIRVASARYLLAMKLLASRVERDEDDVRVLLQLCNITRRDEALDLVTEFYPARASEPKVAYFVADLLGERTSDHRSTPTD